MPEEGKTALPVSVRQGQTSSLSSDLALVGATQGRSVLIVAGDAARQLSSQDADARRRLVERVIVPIVCDTGAIVITGGTNCGVMQEVGTSLGESSPRSLLIGVAPDAKLRGFGADPNDVDSAEPEPHHRVVRTDGTKWGDEGSILVDIAERLASSSVVMLVVGGGEGTKREIELAMARRWPVLLITDIGGTSDDLASGLGADRRSPSSGSDSLLEALRSACSRGEVRTESARSGQQVARALRWALSDDTLLREAWTRYDAADRKAGALKVPTGLGARTLVVLATLTVVAAMSVGKTSAGSGLWLALKLVATSLPLLAGVVLALLERSARAGTWVSLRDAAESVLREVYRFRAGAAPYGQGASTSARGLLAEALVGVDSRAGLRIADEQGNPPTWPPEGLRTRIPAGDQLLGTLEADTYDVVRVQDQLGFLARAASRKSRFALLWSAAIYLATALAALALAVSWRFESTSAVAAVAAAVVAAVASWRQYQGWEQEARSYRATIIEIRAIRARWLALGESERFTGGALAEYAGTVEKALAAEGAEWERSVRESQQRFFDKHRGD